MANAQPPERARPPLAKLVVKRSLSTSGWLLAGIITYDILILEHLSDYLWVQLVHIALGALVGTGLLPLVLEALITLHCGAVLSSFRTPRSPALDIAWEVYIWSSRVLTVLGMAYAVVASETLRARRINRLVVGAAVALIASLLLPLTLATHFAEDVLPRPAEPSPVETPALRDLHCSGRGGAEVAASAAAAGVVCGPVEPLSWSEGEQKAVETVAKMTSEERHTLMRGIGWQPLLIMGVPKRGYYMGNTAPIPRLGVPPLKMQDAGNGFRNNPPPLGKMGTSTCWPSALALAATWDEALVHRVAAAIGREYRGKGANLILGPAVQVHRVARNGRNFEYLSGEDPYLGSRLAAAYVRGVQGEGVMACAKHWAFNEQETSRGSSNSVVDERTAWELYYPPFEAAVMAGVGSFMCSYNKVNGTYACENEALLRRDLKERMGFRGFVMSDWWALHATSVAQGFDQEMPGVGAGFWLARDGPWMTHQRLEEKERQGLPNATEPALRILAATYKLRLPDRPGCTPGKDCVAALESDQRSPAHEELAHSAATQAVVLLKNRDALLPLSRSKGTHTVALLGNALEAVSLHVSGKVMPPGDYYMGGGSGHCSVEPAQLVTPLAALRTRAEAANIAVLTSDGQNRSQAVDVARRAGVAIVVAATTCIEAVDRPNLHLDDRMDELIQEVAREVPTVVLLMVPGTILLPWRDDAAAIAVQFFGGEKTGPAWASVVFGDASPAGKLPILLPRTKEGTIEPATGPDAVYAEGLFTSYRAKGAAEHTAFPFGHGLSYAEFAFSAPVALVPARCPAPAVLCVEVTVTNRSPKDGWSGTEVAQCYVEFPPDAEEPKLLLRGLQRTAVLRPGASEAVVFGLTARDLSIWRGGGWQLQRSVTVHVGASSADLRGTLPNLKVAATA